MVGCLPSRRLAVMSLIGNTSPPPNEVDELFAIFLHTSSVLTSADVIIYQSTKPFVINCTVVKAFALGEKVSRSDG